MRERWCQQCCSIIELQGIGQLSLFKWHKYDIALHYIGGWSVMYDVRIWLDHASARACLSNKLMLVKLDWRWRTLPPRGSDNSVNLWYKRFDLVKTEKTWITEKALLHFATHYHKPFQNRFKYPCNNSLSSISFIHCNCTLLFLQVWFVHKCSRTSLCWLWCNNLIGVYLPTDCGWLALASATFTAMF